MALKIKRRLTGAAGAPAALLWGQLAWNSVDKTLYFGDGDDGSGNATSIQVVGGLGLFPASALTAGAYTKITVDARGRITAVAQLAAADIPSIPTSKLSDLSTTLLATPISSLAPPAGNFSFGGYRLTSLGTPTVASDAATKGYVDATKQGLFIKDPARVASTANVAITAPGTAIDGITLNAGDRVLLKDQATLAENGVYIFNGSAAAMTRAVDFDANADVASGAYVFVKEGSAYGDASFVLTTDSAITIGTTALTFVQFSGAGQISVSNPFNKVGNALSLKVGTGLGVNGTNGNLEVTGKLSTIVGLAAPASGLRMLGIIVGNTIGYVDVGTFGQGILGAADGATAVWDDGTF